MNICFLQNFPTSLPSKINLTQKRKYFVYEREEIIFFSLVKGENYFHINRLLEKHVSREVSFIKKNMAHQNTKVVETNFINMIYESFNLELWCLHCTFTLLLVSWRQKIKIRTSFNLLHLLAKNSALLLSCYVFPSLAETFPGYRGSRSKKHFTDHQQPLQFN